ncbi:MAG: penicillin-binding protein 2 [Patescibacteria group bacterium]
MGTRFTVILGFILVAYSFLLFHLYEVQFSQGEYYQAKAASQEFASSLLRVKRGVIYFTNKNNERIPVGISKDFPVIYAVPKDVKDVKAVALLLASKLDIPVEEIEKKLSKEKDPYELIGDRISSEVARSIDNLKMKGIYVTTEPRRFYPFGTRAAHLLGYVGPAPQGTGTEGHYGIEGLYNDYLAGISGALENKKITQPVPGKDLTLTLDSNIQNEAERILENLVAKHKAEGGDIIVEDPQTGKILAMASRPGFDPNNYREAKIGNFLNPTIQEIYEPGSIFKVITMAAGIDSGKIAPDTTYVDTGTLTLNGRTIENYDLKTKGPYGKVTMANVIEHSINTGAVFAQRTIGRDIFKQYVERFGFGEKTGIDLLGELKGNIRRLSSKEKDIAFATASYGQGVATTPLEVINAIAALANGGKLMRPYVNAELAPQVIRTVVTKTTAGKVTDMMISAVDKAEIAKIKSYTIAGKTGTAYIPDFKKGGYTDDVINTYVGFGPTKNSRFVILVKLDKPEGAPVASLTVVPAFRDLAQFILNYYNIPPDRLDAEQGEPL